MLQDEISGAYACDVCYGTRQLKFVQRGHLDIIVQNHDHMAELGLAMATRFDLDQILRLPWNEEYFGCWSDSDTPVRGYLDEADIRDFAFKMMRRRSR